MMEMRRRSRQRIRRTAARFSLPLVGIVGLGLVLLAAVVAGWLE